MHCTVFRVCYMSQFSAISPNATRHIDIDDFSDEADLLRSVTTHQCKDRPSFLLARMNNVRRRHGDRRVSYGYEGY